MKLTLLLLICALIMVLPSMSWAWDCVYDGIVLPNDASLSANRWTAQGNTSMCSTDGDVLQIDDVRSDALEAFYRDADAGPITIESRVRVAGGSEQAAFLGIGTTSFSTGVALYSSHLVVGFDYGDSPVTYTADLTVFRILRIAINAQGQSYVWLDQTLVAHGVTQVGGQGNVFFGGSSEVGIGQSYWDYVAYSNEFLPASPVPEPGSLVALCAGLIPLAFRRRRG